MDYNLESLKKNATLLHARIILAETMLSNMECFETDVYPLKRDSESNEIVADEKGNYLRDYEKVDSWYMQRFPIGFSEVLVADMGNELMGVVTHAVIAWTEGKKTASK